MNTTFNFKNKNIFITGASSGIGEGLARSLAYQGANLILSARSENRLKEVAIDCRKQGVQVKVLPLDLTKLDFNDGIAKETLSLFEQTDILINSAGIGQRSLVKDTITEVDQAIMKLNYFGTVELTRAILPFMLARQSGHIVIISSVVGKFGTPMRSSYAASKHALHGYFDSLRAEVSKDGIYVTLVCPGHIRTEISRNSLTGNGSKYSKCRQRSQEGHAC